MNADQELLALPQRQSPFAVIFLALRILRGVGAVNIGIAVIFLFNAPVPGGVFVLVPIVGLLLLGLAALAWWRYTFVVVEDELRVTKGVLSEDRLTIPLARVQSVSIDQDFIRRPIGLVRASLDTAGTDQAEFTIDAIDRSIAEALQRLSAERRMTAIIEPGSEAGDQPPPPPVPDIPNVKRAPLDLVKLGLAQSPWAGLAVIAPFIAFADEFGGVFEFGLNSVSGTEWNASRLVYALLLVLVLGTLLSMVLQVVREVITNWDLTLTKTPSGLRRTSGLFSRVSRASSFARVQRLATHQSPVRRIIGFRRVSLPTIGAGDLSMSGCTDEEIMRIRELVLDPDEIVNDLDRRVSPLAVFLEVRNTTIVLAPIVAVLVVLYGRWGTAVLIILPIVWLVSRRHNRNLRWGLSSRGLARTSHIVSVATSEVAMRKAQRVVVRQSFFERRRGLATVEVSTASGSISIPMIDQAEARSLRDRVVYAAETDTRAWM